MNVADTYVDGMSSRPRRDAPRDAPRAPAPARQGSVLGSAIHVKAGLPYGPPVLRPAPKQTAPRRAAPVSFYHYPGPAEGEEKFTVRVYIGKIENDSKTTSKMINAVVPTKFYLSVMVKNVRWDDTVGGGVRYSTDYRQTVATNMLEKLAAAEEVRGLLETPADVQTFDVRSCMGKDKAGIAITYLAQPPPTTLDMNSFTQYLPGTANNPGFGANIDEQDPDSSYNLTQFEPTEIKAVDGSTVANEAEFVFEKVRKEDVIMPAAELLP